MTPDLVGGEQPDQQNSSEHERSYREILPEQDFKRCRKLFDQVYKRGTMTFEDVVVIHGDNKMQWLDRVDLFVNENNLKGEMNLDIQSREGQQLYGVRLDNRLVFNWSQSETGNAIPDSPNRQETERVWAIIKTVAQNI